jgi:hypothetical protein
MPSKLQISRPLFFWAGFLMITQFMNGFHNAHDTIYTPNNFGWLVFYWALGWWFINDSRKHGIRWVDEYMDTGMFLYIGWIVLVPIYFFKTYGWKALIIIGLLLGMVLLAYIGGAVFYSFMRMLF